MSVDHSDLEVKVTYDNIVSFIREHEEPIVTAGEIAAEFKITNQAANYRLKKLQEKERIESKDVGASAKVWYATG